MAKAEGPNWALFFGFHVRKCLLPAILRVICPEDLYLIRLFRYRIAGFLGAPIRLRA